MIPSRNTRRGWAGLTPFAVAAALFLSAAVPLHAAVIYVSPAGGGDGTATGTPTDFATALLTVITNGEADTVNLQQGTYDAGAAGGFRYFWVSGDNNGFTVSGGWNSLYTEQSMDPSLTVLNGGGSTRVMAIASGSTVTINATLEALTFANGYVINRNGAGLYLNGNIDATIRNCAFENNNADTNSNGGAIYSSVPFAISDSTFSGNRGNMGGAIYIGDVSGGDQSLSPLIERCSFDNNINYGILGQGSTIYNAVSPRIMDCDFAGVDGGGSSGPGSPIYSANGSSLDVRRSVFRDFSITGNGSAIRVAAAGARISDSLFYGNTAGDGGNGTGAVAYYNVDPANTDDMTITNCTFVDNTGDPQIGGTPGAVYTLGAVDIVNSILWGNGNLHIFKPSVSAKTATISNSIIEGGHQIASGFAPGANILSSNPSFLNAGANDYHITGASPARNSGSNVAPDIGTSDIDGDPRIVDGTVDMGADEFFPDEVRVFRSGTWLLYYFDTGGEGTHLWTGTFGAGCIPTRIDHDGDHVREFSLFCGDIWHFFNDNGSYNKGIATGGFAGDRPVPADYDGDGDEDVVIFRDGAWLGFDFDTGAQSWGVWTGSPPHQTGGTPVPYPMDYDGDGMADFTVYSGGPWHFFNADGGYNKGIWTGGVAGDIPAGADYDGNGTDDVVVFRAGAWLFYNFTTGAEGTQVWTGSPDHWTGGTSLPAPMDYDGDGAADFTVYSGGPWHFYNGNGTYNKGIWTGGVAGDMAVSRRQLP